MSQTSSPPAWTRHATSDRAVTAAVVVLLLLEIPLALLSVRLAPEGSSVAAFWPNAGVSVAALILTAPRWRPLTLTGVFVVTVLGNMAGERAFNVAAGFGVANVGEAALAIWLIGTLRPRPPEPLATPATPAAPTAFERRPRLDTVDDFIRLFVACGFASALGGLLAGATVGLLQGGDGLAAGRAVVASHLAAMLLIVPLAMRLPRDPPPLAPRLEVLAQWATLAAIVGTFYGARSLPLIFISYPVLVWGALRFQPRLTAIQLLVAGGAVTLLASVRGGPYLDTVVAAGEAPEAVGTLLQAHLLATALVTLPLAMMKSQRLRALDELTASHEEMDAILSATTGTAIVGISRCGRVEYVNVGAEGLTGYTASAVMDRAVVTLLDEAGSARPGDAGGDTGTAIGFTLGAETGSEPLSDLVDPLLDASGGAVVRDWVFERADGERITASVALSRRYDASGAPAGYLAVAEDVTERRRQERSVQQALASEKLVVDRLAQLDQTKNDFLATVSHELRTPITSILGYSQLLLGQSNDDLPAIQRQVVGRIERNGRRLMGLIEDMLAMSQIEVGSFGVTRVPIDVRDPLALAVESILPLLPERDLTLVQDVADDPVRVAGDADKLERAFENLLSNAVKFSIPGDQVAVALHAVDGEVVFSVTDTGIGIDARDQAQLFERFFRGAEATSLAIQGAGLGLSIAATIVNGHDGRIDIQSAPGEGSTFTIRLPRLVDDAPHS